MMIVVSIVGAIQLQEASAAKPLFCYPRSVTGGVIDFCVTGGMQECREAQSSDPRATGDRCHPVKP
jgi:hypothetical protein